MAELTFDPISRETVSAQIRSQLLERIKTGDLAPGTRMPSERDLSDQFHVARTSVREAMQGLLSLGVVERRGNRSFVAEYLPDVVVNRDHNNKSFVAELFETRRVLEVPVFELAAARATEEARATVKTLSAQFSSALAITEFRKLDRAFHTTIASSCDNPLLLELYGKVLDQLFRSQEFDALLGSEKNRASVEAIIAASSADHVAIADAFVASDPAAMRRATEAHLNAVEQSMLDDLVD